MNQFVCEFIESESGVVYFSQIKAFSCDFKFNGEDVGKNKKIKTISNN